MPRNTEDSGYYFRLLMGVPEGRIAKPTDFKRLAMNRSAPRATRMFSIWSLAVSGKVGTRFLRQIASDPEVEEEIRNVAKGALSYGFVSSLFR